MTRPMRAPICLCLAACLATSVTSEAQKGYTLVDERIVVDRREHWEKWNLPGHLVDLDDSGALRSRTLRTVFNVLEDAEFARPVQITGKDARIMNVDSTLKLDVLGDPVVDTQKNIVYDYFVGPGISRVGSNRNLAANVIDGDPATFWEPDPTAPLEEWWIEIDLGRLVPVERIVVRFVDEEIGDPFYKYVILMATRQSLAVGDDGRLSFGRFVPHEGVNTSQRVFVFDSQSVGASSTADPSAYSHATGTAGGLTSSENKLFENSSGPSWSGKLVQTIRIVVTDTRAGRAEPLAEANWQALPAHERGDVIYFVRDLAGREEPTEETTYAELEDARRGHLEYFRRELPRLAEVEVWGWGDNLGVGLVAGGGTMDFNVAGKSPAAGFDGEEGTFYQHNTRDPLNPGANVLNVDIGGTVWLDQIRVVGANMRGFIMRASSGARDAQGNLRWHTITHDQHENNLDLGFFQRLNNILQPSRKIRYLDLITLANFDGYEHDWYRFWPRFNEIMLFSSGAPAEATIESNLIELPGLRTLGAISWEAETPAGTEVEIRTRSGDQLIQRVRYYKTDGVEVETEALYNKLFFTVKGPIDTTFVTGPGWSPWSQKYLVPGQAATSPSLRRFLQFQVRLKSEDRNAVPALRSLSLQTHTPVAQQLLAEVWPQEARVGLADTFEVWVQPRFIQQPANLRSLGFDELRLNAEPELEMEVLDVALGTPAQFDTDVPQRFFNQPRENGLADAEGRTAEILHHSDSLLVRFPEPLVSVSDDELAPIYFRQVVDADEVPTGLDGKLLTRNSHARLPPEEQGRLRYFSRLDSGLREVNQDEYEGLEADRRGPVRYFRKIVGLGNQTAFDTRGDSLSRQSYSGLPSSDRGWIVGRGQLMRLRLRASVFLHGTHLNLSVRNGVQNTPWQQADGGEATLLRPSEGLTVGALGASDVLSDVIIQPNPFTPNGDGVNDRTRIEFSVFKAYEARQVQASLFDLAGNRVRGIASTALGGRWHLAWDGRDEIGRRVPPGVYMCKLHLSVDSELAAGQVRVHLVAVVY